MDLYRDGVGVNGRDNQEGKGGGGKVWGDWF
jgi:hypothetical protein